MSTFLSMFDRGFTSQRVLMPHRCKFCPRYFQEFHQLKRHVEIHKQFYRKHWLKTITLNIFYSGNKNAYIHTNFVKCADEKFTKNSNKDGDQNCAIREDNNKVFRSPLKTDTSHDDQHSLLCNSKYQESSNVYSTQISDKKVITAGFKHAIKVKQEVDDTVENKLPIDSITNDPPFQADPPKYNFVKLNSSKYYFSRTTPYRCLYCTKSFSKSSNRLIHQRAHLKDPFPWVCKECTKKFRSRVALEVHTRTHTGEKPYRCQYCNSNFSTKGYLNVHVRGHTGEMPYQCEFCNKSFRESCKLTVHRRTHTLEKPYKCKFCENTFSQRGNARKHERIHTGEKPFKCCHCDKEYTNFRNFKRHEGTHTGVAAYKCSYCALSFTFRRSLKTHEKVHTGGNVFVCVQCNGTFSSPSNLRRHKKDVHYS